MRIHKVRHTYRTGDPLLPWVYAIARHVRIDSFRKRHRIAREIGVDSLPEPAMHHVPANRQLPGFAELVVNLPESEREILTMLKVEELSLEDVARATCSTIGAVKQKAHRAYKRLRSLLEQLPAHSVQEEGER